MKKKQNEFKIKYYARTHADTRKSENNAIGTNTPNALSALLLFIVYNNILKAIARKCKRKQQIEWSIVKSDTFNSRAEKTIEFKF